MLSNEHRGLCLFGAGGHGRVVGSIAKRVWSGEVVFGDSNSTLGTQIGGIPVKYSRLNDLLEYHLIVTLGDNAARKRLQTCAEEIGLSCAYLIADSFNYFGEEPGGGSMILTSAVVNVGARLGRGVIVNTGALVEHDCTISHFCHLAPNSVVLGGCTLGDNVWLGANATVLQGLNICSNVIIGAGSVVARDIIEPGTYVGVPSTRIS